ncbi:Stk1 family PASTA domain-containing Ser/Thr kinase [Gandjariella thermophila]|uniref:non-specific serine/threonine protein kinase n=1 Tax=Gandjariella thermophila TaxID=1931992 RepID=A0A4D4J4G8_9PSEU|nr:PASTA domain-containing protein [Gandjariella thermophila]GDY30364.1 serine/threonine protein kinase [Gandjariella thermophila]
MDTQSGGLIGRRLEQRYRVDELLARGGMSTVYRGMDTRLDRPVAIKVMDPRFSADRAFVDRFVREARAAARLQHPAVVDVYDQGVDSSSGEDHMFLVMELLDGGTLRDLLTECGGALPVPIALSVLERVLSALAAAHRAGLVHRDIKPENVLVGRGGEVKVADFGLVRAVASAGTTSNSMILGTVAYLAPEQVATGASDARSDVYAAGIVLYEMLTGAPPFTADTPISVAYQHVNSDVPAPSSVNPWLPAELDELVRRATARDPSARLADAEAFLAELGRVREALGVEAVPVPAPGREPATVRLAPLGDAPEGGPRGTRALARSELVGLDTREPAPRPVDGYPGERRRGRRTVRLWTVVVLALAGVLATTAWWLGSTRWTTVPPVAGMDQTAAERALQNAQLTPHLTRQADNHVPAGRVIATRPDQGTRARRGTEVQVLVSSGRPVVPAVAPGVTAEEAEQAIRAAGLQPRRDDTANAYDDTVPRGRVVRLNPPSGTSLDVGATVTVVLSRGRAPRPVPDVTGMPHDQAFQVLRNAGLQPYDKGATFSAQFDAGQVVSTDPPAGTTLTGDDSPRVGVVVSNAVTVPNLSGQPVAQAQQILAQLGLTARVQQFVSRPDSRVFAQLPTAGSRVQPGSTVLLAAFP